MTSTDVRTSQSALYTRDSLFIGGTWDRSPRRRTIAITDPYTEQVIGSVPEADRIDADNAIATAVDAFRNSSWRTMSYVERAAYLGRIADELEARNDSIVEAYVHDFGGVRTFGQFITAQSVLVMREHLRFAEELQDGPQWSEAGGERNLLVREPAGPVLAIVPWNAPMVLAVVKIAPALLAGCSVVVKVAPENPVSSFLLAEAIEASGLPQGLVSFLPAKRESLGDIATRPEFAHIAFTGSSASGVNIMKAAAENITGVTLELGGKSAGIFFDDLDPVMGAQLTLAGSLGQSGQVCTTYSRLLVPESRAEEWRTALVNAFESLTIGDPNDEATNFGPLISAEHRVQVEKYIQIAREEGGTILTGGGRPANQPTGYFVEPTLVGDVTNDMRIVQEEVFGPVIVLQTYHDLDDAVEIANSTDFGLAAGIFTEDIDKAVELAQRLEAGNIGINSFGACLVQPFGGYKKSGLGREGGVENVLALQETKQIRMPRDRSI